MRVLTTLSARNRGALLFLQELWTYRADRLVLGRGGVCVGRRRGGVGGAGLRGRRRALLAGRGFLRLLRALLHLLRAFLGDDDVALLRRLGLVVDRLQRVRPGLSGRLAGAGRIELAAVFEGVRQRGVGLAVDRDRLVD